MTKKFHYFPKFGDFSYCCHMATLGDKGFEEILTSFLDHTLSFIIDII